MAKKYYWLKLKEDFFRQKEIKKLRKIAGGDTYTIIYLKLQLLSLQHEGRIYFEGVEDDFAAELALELDEDIENVRMTLLYLQKHNLLECAEVDGEYFLTAVPACTGRESDSAERMRRSRAKQKQLSGEEASHSDTDVRKSDTEIEIESEKDKEEEEELREENFSISANDDFVSDIQISEIIKKLNFSSIDFSTKYGKNFLLEWLTAVEPDCIVISAEITEKLAKNPNIGYMEKVLIDWQKKNITTAAAARAAVADHEQKKSQQKKQHKRPAPEQEYEIYVPPAGLSFQKI